METASIDQKSGFSSPDFEQLAKDAVSSWSLDLDELSLIKQRENAVFSLRTRDGQRYALRVHRSGYHTDAELRSEIEWMRSLKAHGVKTADVIPTLDGQGFTVVANHQIDLLQWIDAAPIGAIEEQNRDGAELSNAYRQVGAIMAQMHDHAATWSLPGGFERHAWDEDGLVGPEPFWGNFLALDVLNDDNRALLQKAGHSVMVAVCSGSAVMAVSTIASMRAFLSLASAPVASMTAVTVSHAQEALALRAVSSAAVTVATSLETVMPVVTSWEAALQLFASVSFSVRSAAEAWRASPRAAMEVVRITFFMRCFLVW